MSLPYVWQQMHTLDARTHTRQAPHPHTDKHTLPCASSHVRRDLILLFTKKNDISCDTSLVVGWSHSGNGGGIGSKA